MSFCQPVYYTLEWYVRFQYNKIIVVNIVFASLAGLLNFDFVVTAYRWTFHSGKAFFNSIFDTSIENVKPFQIGVLMNQTHIYMSLVIDCALDLFSFVVILQQLFLSCESNALHIQIWYLVCFVDSKNSWMRKGHSNFIWILIAHRTLYIYANFTAYIAYQMRPNISNEI